LDILPYNNVTPPKNSSTYVHGSHIRRRTSSLSVGSRQFSYSFAEYYNVSTRLPKISHATNKEYHTHSAENILVSDVERLTTQQENEDNFYNFTDGQFNGIWSILTRRIKMFLSLHRVTVTGKISLKLNFLIF